MNKFLYKSGLAALAFAAFLSSCKPEIDAPKASAGEANFERYVSLGNSLTAGFADGALYRGGQEVSYPSILAQQFKLVGGGEFKQPLITVGPNGDIGAGSPIVKSPTDIQIPSKLVLGSSKDCRGTTSLAPVRAAASGDASILITDRIGNQGPFNNMGVPGALSYHLLAPGYGGDLNQVLAGKANPFYSRFASSTSTSIIQDAMRVNPTFFTLWIGNNDVLGYALAGGAGEPTPVTGGTPTNPSFDLAIGSLINTLTSGGAKGAIANIPDVTQAPFFNTVPYNGLVLDTAQAALLTQAYAPFGIKFRVGPNPFIIKDNVPGGRRQLKPSEKVLLSISQDSLKCSGLGSQIPISKKDILTDSELTTIKNAVTGYNNVIKTVADSKGIALVDAFKVMNSLQTGISRNQVNYNSTLVTGNVFSLDGLHFTPRGNAIVANEFIKAINEKYKSSIPTVNETNYNAVLFP